MKLNIKLDGNLTSQQKSAIEGLLNYSMNDVSSWDELTSIEKKIIDKETFNSMFN